MVRTNSDRDRVWIQLNQVQLQIFIVRNTSMGTEQDTTTNSEQTKTINTRIPLNHVTSKTA
jgi:hypothetical protein